MSKLHDRLNRRTEVWKPKPHDVIEGKVVEVTTFEGDYGRHPVYVVVDDSGATETTIHAGRRVLRDQLASVRVGDEVAIRYEGEVEGRTGTKYHNYKTVIEPAERAAPATRRPLDADIDNGLLFDEGEPPDYGDEPF